MEKYMLLEKLLQDVEVESQYDKSIDIVDIATDSRKVQKGDIFIALQGTNFDGNDYIKKALENGARLVVSDKLQGENIIKVKNARKCYALICKNFFQRACDKLKIIAITGTNGKTTVANLCGQVLNLCGRQTAVIGTLGAKINDKIVETGLTTPDPYRLYSLFQKIQDEGIEYVVMEASAHALYFNKLAGIRFEVALLTNITEDHLDFFENMENYAQAKYLLFKNGATKSAVVCGDDSFCEYLLSVCKVPTLSYGLSSKEDLYCKNVEMNTTGSEFDIVYRNKTVHASTNLAGFFNVKNSLACYAICNTIGRKTKEILRAFKLILPVEGRFNIIPLPKNCSAIIDYAHTPDGLKNILQSAKQLAGQGKLVVVFGCGGNRDSQKRPLMGKIASSLADHVIVTSDNPRFEKPGDIIDEIVSGIDGKCLVIEDRAKAIEYALSNFNHGHTIVIAGKGAENYQEIKGKKYPFSDFEIVDDFLRKYKN